MYKRIWLTDADFKRLDPTGGARRFLRSIDRSGTPTPRPHFVRKLTADEWFAAYRDVKSKFLSEKHRAFNEFDESFSSKVGPQGQTFPLSVVLANYEESYRLAERQIKPHPMLYEARDFLIRMIKQRVSTQGYPQLKQKSNLTTAAALPTMKKKGTFFAEAYIQGLNWRHVFPDLPGERFMKNKPRTINQDAGENVRYFEREMGGIREWLKTQFPELFSAWLRPDEMMTPMITRMIDRGCVTVETDYKACDNSFSYALVKEFILPVYEALLPGEMLYLRFAAFVEELFHQPIFFGSYMLTGLHNLLSGQLITNDFETIFDVICALAALMYHGLLNKDWVILALGDDVSILLAAALGDYAQKVKEAFVMFAISAGMQFNLEKCAIEETKVTFCKKLYYRGAPRDAQSNIIGAYPTLLALNSIIMPEHHSKTSGDLLAATLQRLDNTYGTPMFHRFVQFVGSNLTAFDETSRLVATDVERETIDWWERVYSERWSFRSSPSARILAQNQLLNKWVK